MQVISMTQALVSGLNAQLGQNVFQEGDVGKVLVVHPDSFILEHSLGVREWNIGKPPVTLFKDGVIVVNRGVEANGRHQVAESVATQIINALFERNLSFIDQGLSVATA